MHYISSNVHKLMEVKNLSLSEMSRQTGVSKATLSKWFDSDRQPRIDMVEKIASRYDLPIDYFLDDSFIEYWKFDGNEWVEKQDPENEPVYEVSAGRGRSCSSPDGFKFEDGKFAKVVGDSMLPTLRDGDVVRIIATTKVEPSDIALVKINGDENTLKHCEVTSDGLWVRGENKDVFTDRFFTMEECLTIPVQIVGKAVEIVSRKL